MLRRDVRFSSLDANLSQFEPWQNVTYQTGCRLWVGWFWCWWYMCRWLMYSNITTSIRQGVNWCMKYTQMSTGITNVGQITVGGSSEVKYWLVFYTVLWSSFVIIIQKQKNKKIKWSIITRGSTGKPSFTFNTFRQVLTFTLWFFKVNCQTAWNIPSWLDWQRGDNEGDFLLMTRSMI